jgi:TM2 domain-containing membrane protein YozV
MAMIFCRGCGKEIHETAETCPHCGAPQVSTNNQNQVSNDAKLMLLIESKKKSGWIAALLNWFLPGVGYMYCGRVVLGIFAMLFTILVAVVTYGVGLFIVIPVLIADGFLAANRYNKKLLEGLVKETA